LLMLGGMMELGEESVQEHENIAALIKTYKWKDVVLVGGDFKKLYTLSITLIMQQKLPNGLICNILKTVIY